MSSSYRIDLQDEDRPWGQGIGTEAVGPDVNLLEWENDLLIPPVWKTPYCSFNSGMQLPLRQLTQAPIFCSTTSDTSQTP